MTIFRVVGYVLVVVVAMFVDQRKVPPHFQILYGDQLLSLLLCQIQQAKG